MLFLFKIIIFVWLYINQHEILKNEEIIEILFLIKFRRSNN